MQIYICMNIFTLNSIRDIQKALALKILTVWLWGGEQAFKSSADGAGAEPRQSSLPGLRDW